MIEPEEAADICSQVREPGSAAKRLLDLAQAYGSHQAVSVIVVQLKPPVDAYQSSSQNVHEECAILNTEQKHSSDFGSCKEHSEEAQQKAKDMTGLSQKVKFRTLNLLEDARSQCYVSKSRKECNESFLISGINKVKIPHEDDCVVQNIGDLERSSPSGQSQSDYSEYSPDTDRDTRTKFVEFSREKHHKIFQPLTSKFCGHPRKKNKNEKKIEGGSHKTSKSYCSEQKRLAYYHYPRPEPAILPPQGNLQHLQNEPQTSVLAPPAGFGDPGSDSEGSDSGLSGVSGVQNYADHPSGSNLENIIGDSGPEQVRPNMTSYLMQ